MSRKFSSLEDIYDFYQDGGTLASLTNLTQQDLNDLHSYAYTAYQSGDVITARNLFHLLTYLEHWNLTTPYLWAYAISVYQIMKMHNCVSHAVQL